MCAEYLASKFERVLIFHWAEWHIVGCIRQSINQLHLVGVWDFVHPMQSEQHGNRFEQHCQLGALKGIKPKWENVRYFYKNQSTSFRIRTISLQWCCEWEIGYVWAIDNRIVVANRRKNNSSSIFYYNRFSINFAWKTTSTYYISLTVQTVPTRK